MIFKRRDKLSPVTRAYQVLWPQGGWGRAAQYLSHRLHRLPDTPVRISRGIFAGTFVSFSPFFGLHILLALLCARVLRGNFLAAILATCVGNPLTYVPIAFASTKTGHILLGSEAEQVSVKQAAPMAMNAARDLWQNLTLAMKGAPQDWRALGVFWHEVFWPYLIGGFVLGIVCGTAAYYICRPMIAAYQKRRRGRFAAHLKALKKKTRSKNAPQTTDHNCE